MQHDWEQLDIGARRPVWRCRRCEQIAWQPARSACAPVEALALLPPELHADYLEFSSIVGGVLSQRERYILFARSITPRPRSLSELAHQLGISPTRVAQIGDAAIRRLLGAHSQIDAQQWPESVGRLQSLVPALRRWERASRSPDQAS